MPVPLLRLPFSLALWPCLLSLVLTVFACSGGGGGSSGGGTTGPTTSVTQTVGAAGGTVSLPDGRASVQIPAGALTTATSIAITSIASEGPLGSVYDFEPSGLSFSAPVTVTVSYNPALLPANAKEGEIFLASLSKYMEILGDIQVDTINHTVTGKTTHFSQYAACPTAATEVKISQFDRVASTFRMPIGSTGKPDEDLGGDLERLERSSWVNFNYPKIHFNLSGDSNNRWYVSTAFNRDRWLDQGDSEPSADDGSLYCVDDPCSLTNRAFHPGEDWNGVPPGNDDNGKPIHAIGDGIVLLNQAQSGFGNTLVIGHKLASGKIIASFYAHMLAPSSFGRGGPVSKGLRLGKLAEAVESSPIFILK